ncbi:MAG TPA: calcium/proton exchanger [Chloroflexota bacterium]|nr:calcium/proton exchanger [Chloroflexota bacterium]
MLELLGESALNWLLLAVPISILLSLFQAPGAIIFASAAVALVPLAALIGQSTEDIAKHTGPVLGGLLSASFGNATELVVAILALVHGLDEVVKASITGSIIGNALLVLGMSMIAAGIGRERVFFNRVAAATSSATLLLAVTALVMPAVFNLTVYGRLQGTSPALEQLSLLVAIVLIATYGLSLVFSLVTHRALLVNLAEVPEQPEIGPGSSMAILFVVTLVTTLESDLLVGTIEVTTRALGITEFFVGVIIIAIVGNAAEHLSALLVARHGQMDLAVHIATGSSTQIAVFVAPLLVIVSWLIGRPMSLVFNPFEIAAVALASIIVTIAALDGETNWFEGVQLVAVYLILAIAFFYVPVP